MEGINASGILLVKLGRLRLARRGGARMVPAGGEERPQGHPAGPGDTQQGLGTRVSLGVAAGCGQRGSSTKEFPLLCPFSPVWMLGAILGKILGKILGGNPEVQGAVPKPILGDSCPQILGNNPESNPGGQSWDQCPQILAGTTLGTILGAASASKPCHPDRIHSNAPALFPCWNWQCHLAICD